jgi:serine/threonine protein kinase
MTTREQVWPSAREYLDAIQRPGSAFPGRPELAGGSLRGGSVPGFPWSASGANAIVFALATPAGRNVAVRCFTRRPQNDVDERYRALSDFLHTNPCPLLAAFEWMDGAMVIDGRQWPVLQMEWIDGDPLKVFVRQHLDRRPEIEALSDTWLSAVADLERRGFAHGDLQHGNIMVRSPSALRLVDLDGVWCPSTESYGSREAGLPAYQHPERMLRRSWGPTIDRFSTIVVYVSLRALAAAKRAIDILSPGDSLVLSADDIKAAADQNARDEAWSFLLESPDREVARLANELHAACRRPLDQVPSLTELVKQLASPIGPAPSPPPSNGHQLNEWQPRIEAPPTPSVDNRWNGEAAAATAPGRRVRPATTPQRWEDGDGRARRPHPQSPQRASGPAGPLDPGRVAPRAGGSTFSAVTAWMAMTVGLLLVVLGFVAAASDVSRPGAVAVLLMGAALLGGAALGLMRKRR